MFFIHEFRANYKAFFLGTHVETAVDGYVFAGDEACDVIACEEEDGFCHVFGGSVSAPQREFSSESMSIVSPPFCSERILVFPARY
jgi:hypothetical protein